MNAIIFFCIYFYLQRADASPGYFNGLFCAVGLWYGPGFWEAINRLWLKFNRKLDEWADV